MDNLAIACPNACIWKENGEIANCLVSSSDMTANSLLAVCFEPSLKGIWAKFNWSLLERVVAVALWMACTWCFVGLMIARYLFYFFQVKGLLEVPAASSGVSAMKILASVGLAVTGIAIISGIYLSNKRWALLSTGLMIISGIYIFLARGDMTDCWESCGKWKFSCSNNSWEFCYKIHVFLDCIDWQRINFFVRAGKILICVCIVTISLVQNPSQISSRHTKWPWLLIELVEAKLRRRCLEFAFANLFVFFFFLLLR